jgi:hypothetical protein
MDFSGLGITKLAATVIVGAGTKKIVTGIIKDHVVGENRYDKFTIGAATIVLSAVVARQAKKYTDDTIQDIADYVKTTVKAMQEGESLIDEMLHKDAAIVVVTEPIVKDKTPANASSTATA